MTCGCPCGGSTKKPPSHHVNAFVRPPTHHVNAFVRPPTHHVNAFVRPPSHPVNAFVRPPTHPVNAFVRPPSHPVNAFVWPPPHPVNAFVWPPPHPVNAFVRVQKHTPGDSQSVRVRKATRGAGSSPIGCADERALQLQLGLHAPQLLLPLGQFLLHLGLLHFQPQCHPVQPVHVRFPARREHWLYGHSMLMQLLDMLCRYVSEFTWVQFLIFISSWLMSLLTPHLSSAQICCHIPCN